MHLRLFLQQPRYKHVHDSSMKTDLNIHCDQCQNPGQVPETLQMVDGDTMTAWG